MTHRDEIEKSVDEMLAGWFNGERHDVDRNDIIELVMKHSTVDAEPFGWIKPGAATNDEKYDYGMFAYRQQEDTPVAIYTTPPAPSVAVKALQDHVLADFTHLTDAQALSGPYIVKRIKERFGSFAFSAQVQDVAGHEPFGAPGPDAMRVIDPDQWEPCSPDYLKRGGCCATAPRVWNAERLNHYHPKFPAAPAKQEGS